MEDIDALVERGVFPEGGVLAPRLAGVETAPAANTEEIIVFLSFFKCGFGMPASDFF